MKIKFAIIVFCFGFHFFVGCASSSIQDKQLTGKELEETEILGSIQSNFNLDGTSVGMLNIPPSADTIKGKAYSKLLEEAQKKYSGNIDIRNITISENSKKSKLMKFGFGYEYSYSASGNVISTYSASARVANRLSGITNKIIDTFKGNKNATIAVFYFVNIDGKNSVLGRYLIEQISNCFFQNSELKIVERARIMKIINEQNFGVSGYVSDDSVARIGHLLGANAVSIGTLTKVGNRISVNIKIVESETGSILSSGSTEIEGTEYLEMYNELLE
jgi:TolB-like protein